MYSNSFTLSEQQQQQQQQQQQKFTTVLTRCTQMLNCHSTMFVCSGPSVDAQFRWTVRNGRQLVAQFLSFLGQNQRELVNYEATIIKYFESFFSLLVIIVRHAKQHYTVACGLPRSTTFSHIILSPVACPALQHFPTLYCRLWPASLYNIFPHYIVACGLPRSTTFSHIILSPVACPACPALQHFPTLSHERHDFR